MPLIPLPPNPNPTSPPTVPNPAAAATCAIPEPISPHPTTPTFRIVIFSTWKCRPPRQQEEPSRLAYRRGTIHRSHFVSAQILPETNFLYAIYFLCLVYFI